MEKRIVIVGAGIAGLSTGCYARMNGYDAEIHEAQGGPGGLCTAWKRKGYTIDGSIHWLVGSGPAHPFYRMWRELGAVQGRPMVDREIFYRVRGLSGRSLELHADADRLERHLKEISPADSRPIEELCAVARRMADFGLPPGKPPELMGPLEGMRVMRYYKKRMADLKFLSGTKMEDYADRFSDPFLRECFANIFYGMKDATLAPLVMSMGPIARKAAGFPMGGSLEFAKAIERRFLGLGGRLVYGSRALRVVERDGRAAGIVAASADGSEREVPADFVVSCADLKWSLEGLLGGRHADESQSSLFESERLYEPTLMVSFGVDLDLSGQTDAMNEIMELPRPISIAGRETKWLNYRNYSFDPAFAPKGKSLVGLALMSDYSYWERLAKDDAAYRAEKAAIAAACAQALEARYPGFRSKIEMTDVATPLTFARYTGNWKGSCMSWILSREYQRKYRWVRKTVAGLEGFFLASMWTNPPGGVPGAASAGRQVVQLVCAADRRRFHAYEPTIPA